MTDVIETERPGQMESAKGRAGRQPGASNRGSSEGEPVERVEPVAEDRNAERLADLLERCGAGDVHAFDRLYETTSSRLYGLALRMLRDPETAEDVLQDAYLSIWDKAGSYRRSLGEPLSWMCSIARYRALDQLRRRKHREHAQRPLDEDGFADAIDGHRAQERNDDGVVLQRCLERLKPEARSCVVLAFCEGYSHDELSERFATPLGTVKSWIRRGVASLRNCIDELA